MRIVSQLLTFIAVLCIAGCAQPSQAQTAEPFVVKGRVTDESGRPMKGVEVVADNEFLYAAYATGRTGSDGRYRIQLPRAASTWNVTASTKQTIDSQTFEIDLAPDNPDSFAGNTGAVRNFSVKRSGEHQSGTGQMYGGYVVVYPPFISEFRGTDVQLTLQPINGGPTIVGQPVNHAEGDSIRDVPLGQYRLSASLNGRPLRIRVRNQGSFGPAVTAGFKQIMKGVNELEVEVE